MFVHVVFFWLKPGTPGEVREQMIRSIETDLKQIPSVRHIWAGRPAMTPRDVVDNSYDVGLCVTFDDAAGHDVYQPHDLHKAFSANFKQYWEHVRVYDFH